MAWKYPRHDIRSGFVADIDAINDNFLAVVDETSGSLNEHNFDSSKTVLKRQQLAKDGAFSIHVTKSNADPSNFSTKTGWQEIQKVDDWQSFDADGATLNFIGRGSMVYVCASFQLIATDGLQSVRRESTLLTDQMGFGFAVALRVDGTLIFDSLLGSGDSSSEFYRGFKNRGGDVEPTNRDGICIPQGGGGVSGARLPVTVDAVLNLPPGPHKIEIAVMNIRANMQSSGSDDKTYIASRELFALEMLR
jgi:hypothetical protein